MPQVPGHDPKAPIALPWQLAARQWPHGGSLCIGRSLFCNIGLCIGRIQHVLQFATVHETLGHLFEISRQRHGACSTAWQWCHGNDQKIRPKVRPKIRPEHTATRVTTKSTQSVAWYGCNPAISAHACRACWHALSRITLRSPCRRVVELRPCVSIYDDAIQDCL